MDLDAKQELIDRLIRTLQINNWPYPRTSGSLVTTHERADTFIFNMRGEIALRSDGMRLDSSGRYFK